VKNYSFFSDRSLSRSDGGGVSCADHNCLPVWLKISELFGNLIVSYRR
jgi:hypothetical protein